MLAERPPAAAEPAGLATHPAGAEAGLAPVDRADWIRAFRYCFAVYLTLRIALSSLALLVTSIIPNSSAVGVPRWPAVGPSKPWHHAFTGWERWDALWYLSIAKDGYRVDDGSAAFFPLYPLLTRAVAEVFGGRLLLGAYVVSNVALIVALVLVYRLTALEFSDKIARTTVLCLCLFPVGYFLFAPYTESLFLALCIGCLYAARRRSWLLAGSLAALASCTRSTGVLLAAPLAVEGLLQLRESTGPLRPRLLRAAGTLALSASAGLGMLAYLGYWYRRGEWDRPITVQESNWNRLPSLPWETLQVGWQQGTASIAIGERSFRTVDLVLVLVMLVAGAAMTRKVRPTFAVYFWLSVLFPLTLVDLDRPLQSVPRYYLVILPIFWGIALFAHRFRARDLVIPVSAVGLGMMSLLFVTWYPVF